MEYEAAIMEKKRKRINLMLLTAAHIYLLLPILIFCVGWCKWYIGAVMSCIIVVGAYISINKYMLSEPMGGEQHTCKGKLWICVVALLLIALWVVLSGIGGYVWQNDDHFWRNTIFDILVTKKNIV